MNDTIKKIKRKIVITAEETRHKLPVRRYIGIRKANKLSAEINKNLIKYKNLYEGQDVYIIGGGATEKIFTPVKNGIYIGVNRAFKDTRISFDYLFAQDQFYEGMDEFLAYRANDCKKFLAIIPYKTTIQINENELIPYEGERYVLSYDKMIDIPNDITKQPFSDLRGTGFSAVQFALYTNPRHIYLVGFDCTTGDVFAKANRKHNFSYQVESWKIVKRYAERIGKDDCIISVNPVGLKSLFQDVYSDNNVE